MHKLTGNGPISYMHPVEICKLHLENYIKYDNKTDVGTNIAKKRINLKSCDELELLLSNLVSTYDIYYVETALRSLKMYKHCIKYLKVA
jgi:5'(3')-deoxyribonucleotidase